MFSWFKKKYQFQDISPHQFQSLVANKDHIVLDVRSKEEAELGHIPHSIQMDFFDPSFKQHIGDLDKSKTYLVYCRSGNRSTQTCKLMEKMGFQQIYNLKGGYIAWSRV